MPRSQATDMSFNASRLDYPKLGMYSSFSPGNIFSSCVMRFEPVDIQSTRRMLSNRRVKPPVPHSVRRAKAITEKGSTSPGTRGVPGEGRLHTAVRFDTAHSLAKDSAIGGLADDLESLEEEKDYARGATPFSITQTSNLGGLFSGTMGSVVSEDSRAASVTLKALPRVPVGGVDCKYIEKVIRAPHDSPRLSAAGKFASMRRRASSMVAEDSGSPKHLHVPNPLEELPSPMSGPMSSVSSKGRPSLASVTNRVRLMNMVGRRLSASIAPTSTVSKMVGELRDELRSRKARKEEIIEQERSKQHALFHAAVGDLQESSMPHEETSDQRPTADSCDPLDASSASVVELESPPTKSRKPKSFRRNMGVVPQSSGGPMTPQHKDDARPPSEDSIPSLSRHSENQELPPVELEDTQRPKQQDPVPQTMLPPIVAADASENGHGEYPILHRPLQLTASRKKRRSKPSVSKLSGEVQTLRVHTNDSYGMVKDMEHKHLCTRIATPDFGIYN